MGKLTKPVIVNYWNIKEILYPLLTKYTLQMFMPLKRVLKKEKKMRAINFLPLADV